MYLYCIVREKQKIKLLETGRLTKWKQEREGPCPISHNYYGRDDQLFYDSSIAQVSHIKLNKTSVNVFVGTFIRILNWLMFYRICVMN